MEAVAKYDYNGRIANELSFKAGDLLSNIEKVDNNWWKGTLVREGKQGIFRDNLVTIITKPETHKNNETKAAPASAPVKRCRVLYNYMPSNTDELELHENDIVEIISKVEEGWWEGCLNNKVGVFPSNFVVGIQENDEVDISDYNRLKLAQSLEENNKLNGENNCGVSDGPDLPPRLVKDMCIVLYPYESCHEDELTLKEGDVISVISKELPDKGWWRGKLNGKIGVFPDNFVKVLSLPDEITITERPMGKGNNDIMRTDSPTTMIASYRMSVDSPEKKIIPIDKKSSGLPTEKKTTPKKGVPCGGATKVVSSGAAKPSNVFPPKPAVTVAVNETNKAVNDVKLNNSVHDDVDGGKGFWFKKKSNLVHGTQKQEMKEKHDKDLDVIQHGELLKPLTHGRTKGPRRRPPSANLQKEELNDEKDVIDIAPSNDKVEKQGDKFKKPTTWVDELKMNQARKNATKGSTKIMIGSENAESDVTDKVHSLQINKRAGFTGTGTGIVFRQQRPISMYNADNKQPIVISTATQASFSDRITVSVEEWDRMNTKVKHMESRMDAMQDGITKAIQLIIKKVIPQAQDREEIIAELDKLSDFVTQV